MKRYLICLLVGLLTGCTSGSVEEMLEKAQLVAISFGKPDLGIPVILTRSDEAVMPEPTPLPEGATIRVCGYLQGNVGEQTTPAAFSTTAATFESTYEVLADGSLSPCLVDDAGKKRKTCHFDKLSRSVGFLSLYDPQYFGTYYGIFAIHFVKVSYTE